MKNVHVLFCFQLKKSFQMFQINCRSIVSHINLLNYNFKKFKKKQEKEINKEECR